MGGSKLDYNNSSLRSLEGLSLNNEVRWVGVAPSTHRCYPESLPSLPSCKHHCSQWLLIQEACPHCIQTCGCSPSRPGLQLSPLCVAHRSLPVNPWTLWASALGLFLPYWAPVQCQEQPAGSRELICACLQWPLCQCLQRCFFFFFSNGGIIYIKFTNLAGTEGLCFPCLCQHVATVQIKVWNPSSTPKKPPLASHPQGNHACDFITTDQLCLLQPL